jgi:hypothetical protein
MRAPLRLSSALSAGFPGSSVCIFRPFINGAGAHAAGGVAVPSPSSRQPDKQAGRGRVKRTGFALDPARTACSAGGGMTATGRAGFHLSRLRREAWRGPLPEPEAPAGGMVAGFSPARRLAAGCCAACPGAGHQAGRAVLLPLPGKGAVRMGHWPGRGGGLPGRGGCRCTPLHLPAGRGTGDGNGRFPAMPGIPATVSATPVSAAGAFRS